jgi:hypothetical protein
MLLLAGKTLAKGAACYFVLSLGTPTVDAYTRNMKEDPKAIARLYKDFRGCGRYEGTEQVGKVSPPDV